MDLNPSLFTLGKFLNLPKILVSCRKEKKDNCSACCTGFLEGWNEIMYVKHLVPGILPGRLRAAAAVAGAAEVVVVVVLVVTAAAV